MQHANSYEIHTSYQDAFSHATYGDVIQLLDTDGVAKHTMIIIQRDTANRDVIMAAHSRETKTARLSSYYDRFGGGFILYNIK